MQAVTAVIDAQPRDLEAPGEAADARFSFEDEHAPAGRREAQGGAETGRSRAEHDDVERGVVHSSAAKTIAWPTTCTATRSPGWNSDPGPTRERTRPPSASATSMTWSWPK